MRDLDNDRSKMLGPTETSNTASDLRRVLHVENTDKQEG